MATRRPALKPFTVAFAHDKQDEKRRWPSPFAVEAESEKHARKMFREQKPGKKILFSYAGVSDRPMHDFMTKGIKPLRVSAVRTSGCPNCQGQNARTGHVESWDGVCPDCGRKIRR